ncbi:protein SET DOMAIN GROUP 40 isoform X2 [Phalaenopsis equestris]|uniref:protein SET DOMAIN GROUP 40 isoform X2 n=1 Tax=Phalaenopsis equestris TaxID=78828 RepID=UPI0009E3FE61|nr:protein SET DOMAIN GROUP 40 isoform X2 [Phalaenopsis equestris]
MSSIEGPKMEALLCWAAQIGISDDPSQSPSTSIPSPSCLGHSLVVSNFSNAGGRGFAACRDLRMGELILRVPRTALLTKQSVLRDEWLASCMKKRPHLSSSQKLTICLLAEVAKGRDSRWYPYLVLLPSSYNTLPNFHEFEIHALQVEDAIWVSEKAVVRARSDWKESLVVMQEMKLKLKFLSFRSWLWASATVLLSYGTYSNLDLLEHYGFLLSSNPNDKAFLHLDIDSNISDAWSKDLLYIQPDGKPSFALLCSLRLDSTPRNLRRALGHRAFAGFFLSNENEALAMTKLVNHCCVVLDELPTKIEDDASLLSIINEVVDFGACFDRLESAFSHEEFAGFIEANGLQRESLLTAKALRSLERWRLAVHWRLFYKTILSNCLSYCRKVMSEIS